MVKPPRGWSRICWRVSSGNGMQAGYRRAAEPSGSAKCDRERQYPVGVIKPFAVQRPQLSDPVPDGLGMNEQRGGHVVAAALVQQPRAQGFHELLCDLRPKVRQRFEDERTKVSASLG